MKKRANNVHTDAVNTAGEMMRTPMNEVPKLAHEYLRYLSSKYGFCGEVCITAWAHYAQVILGQKCSDDSYKINKDGLDWFKKNKTSEKTNGQ